MTTTITIASKINLTCYKELKEIYREFIRACQSQYDYDPGCTILANRKNFDKMFDLIFKERHQEGKRYLDLFDWGINERAAGDIEDSIILLKYDDYGIRCKVKIKKYVSATV